MRLYRPTEKEEKHNRKQKEKKKKKRNKRDERKEGKGTKKKGGRGVQHSNSFYCFLDLNLTFSMVTKSTNRRPDQKRIDP